MATHFATRIGVAPGAPTRPPRTRLRLHGRVVEGAAGASLTGHGQASARCVDRGSGQKAVEQGHGRPGHRRLSGVRARSRGSDGGFTPAGTGAVGTLERTRVWPLPVHVLKGAAALAYPAVGGARAQQPAEWPVPAVGAGVTCSLIDRLPHLAVLPLPRGSVRQRRTASSQGPGRRGAPRQRLLLPVPR